MLNLRSTTFGAAVAVVAAIVGLTFLARSPRDESGKQAELTARRESSTAPRPRDAQEGAGANPELTKPRESPVAPAPSHGEVASPSAGGNDATRPSGDVEAALLEFFRGEPTPATAAARFNLDQVRFDVARTSPRQASHRQLQSVAQILSAFPKATVFIGYAAGVDRSKAASRIVRARLLSVWRELTRMGVDSARLSLKRPNGSSTVARNPAKRLPPKNAPIFLEISMRSFS
jgi:outer membrane protein OmpA-like peptidoglycan-associated protein